MSAKATSKKKEFPEGAFFDWTATFDDHAPGPLPSIDIGCNLVDDAFEKDVDEVLLRARRAGLSAIVVTGTSVAASERALAFADANSGKEPHGIDIFATCGVHPHDAKSCDASTIPKLRELAQHPKCVAVGECGLDFDRNFSPPETQRAVFEQQLRLGLELGKPLFMHCREASEDLCSIIRKVTEESSSSSSSSSSELVGVVHCFTGTMAEMQRFVEMGLHIGITGWICDDREGRGASLSEVVAQVPQGKLMVETDAPYLTPRSIRPNRVRPWRNEPCLLPHVMHRVAGVRQETMQALANHTLKTSQSFFGLAD